MKESSERKASGNPWLKIVSSLFISRIGRNCGFKEIHEQFNLDDIIVDFHILKKQCVSRGYAFVRVKDRRMWISYSI